MVQITMVENTYTKKQGFKTAYKLENTETKVIDSLTHSRITSEDTCKWFRRLGGSESITREYTCNGYCVTKLISTSPDKQTKKIRTFNFKWIEN